MTQAVADPWLAPAPEGRLNSSLQLREREEADSCCSGLCQSLWRGHGTAHAPINLVLPGNAVHAVFLGEG